MLLPMLFFFFFNDTATTEIYTLSLHDALPISFLGGNRGGAGSAGLALLRRASALPSGAHGRRHQHGDRKSTRLNSSHLVISYAVFCLKKKTSDRDRTRARRAHCLRAAGVGNQG